MSMFSKERDGYSKREEMPELRPVSRKAFLRCILRAPHPVRCSGTKGPTVTNNLEMQPPVTACLSPCTFTTLSTC